MKDGYGKTGRPVCAVSTGVLVPSDVLLLVTARDGISVRETISDNPALLPNRSCARMTRLILKAIDVSASFVFMALCAKAFCAHFYNDLRRARQECDAAMAASVRLPQGCHDRASSRAV